MSVNKYGKGKWYYDFGHEGERYKKKGFTTKREAVQAESIARNKVMKGFKINDKTSFIAYYNDWIKVTKKVLLQIKLMQLSKTQSINLKHF